MRILRSMMVIVALVFSVSCTNKDTQAPKVIQTFPPNRATDVDPSLKQIYVIFDEEMTDGNWSWAYTTENKFPEMAGQPYYDETYTKNILPVKLEPEKEYEIWINSEKFQNFKDKSGNPATPYRWVFKTR